ncbi:hypothetical protein PV569_33470 [Streptomyces scabiei]|uniref:hypothetical protein n=1 Tax=Streptomyces scabiei TaxID=1930 RepID=UPI0029B1434D|nr:hypothetical protein [Streptomyces scabiei]MDX3298573.1 hypothetical protein [Streptomyces scabiei]
MTDRKPRLVPVACTTVDGAPDGIHLSVEKWLPEFGERVTGQALCGRSAEQGALPADTPITCTDHVGSCESYRDSYERALDGRPTAQEEEMGRLRAEVGRLTRLVGQYADRGIANGERAKALEEERDRLGGDLDVYRAEVLALRDELERVAYDRTWPPDRERPADVRREVERARVAGEHQAHAVTLQYQAARTRWDRERDRLTAELEALHTARLNEPILRHCLYPGCLREFDMKATLCGSEPARPTWSGKGWVQVRQLDGNMCPDHVDVVRVGTEAGPHLPRWNYGKDGAPSVLRCPCGWNSPPVRWRRYATEAWKDHIESGAAEDHSGPERPLGGGR